MKLQLPRKDHIKPTEIADSLKLYYMRFYQKRLKMVLNYFPETHCEHLLEIGFGSGIFLKELKGCCESLYGIDTHDKIDNVRNILKLEGLISKSNTLPPPISLTQLVFLTVLFVSVSWSI